MATTQIKNGFHGGTDDQLLVNPDGSINVNSTGGGGGGSNASVGVTGAPAPVSGTEIAGVDDAGNLVPVSVDANGFMNVRGVSSETGLSAFQTSQFTVGTSAVRLAPTPLVGRSSISLSIEADPNVPVYIGNNSSVSVSNGYPLYDGSSLQMDLTDASQIWAVSTQAGQIVAVLEIA